MRATGASKCKPRRAGRQLTPQTRLPDACRSDHAACSARRCCLLTRRAQRAPRLHRELLRSTSCGRRRAQRRTRSPPAGGGGTAALPAPRWKCQRTPRRDCTRCSTAPAWPLPAASQASLRARPPHRWTASSCSSKCRCAGVRACVHAMRVALQTSRSAPRETRQAVASSGTKADAYTGVGQAFMKARLPPPASRSSVRGR